MNCREYREAHPEEPDLSRAHLEACPECRAFRRTWELIGEYPPIEPGAGFVGGLRRKLVSSVLRFAAPAAAAAAAVLVALVLFFQPAPAPVSPAPLTEEQRELAEHLDLLENWELVRALEFVGESASPLMENPK